MHRLNHAITRLPHPPSRHLPVLSIIPFQPRSRPPLAVGIRSRAIKVAVLSASDDVHPGGWFGEFPPLLGDVVSD